MQSVRHSSPPPGVIPAGDFSSWLRQVRDSLLGQGEMAVECGECVGCCSSSYFIHIRPQEKEALRRIPKEVLFPAPGQPKGHMLMGYDQAGLCPMLENNHCVIYEHRPQTCREYDCRIFTAAGIAAGGEEKFVINQRVERWLFSYPAEKDRQEHSAVMAAAKFIREQARYFPGGRAPDNPSQLAILAIKTYKVFMERNIEEETLDDSAFSALAGDVVEAVRQFDNGAECPSNGPIG